jgi:hypothetical protein
MAPLYERDVTELIDATRSYYSVLRKKDVDDLEYGRNKKKKNLSFSP